MTLLSSLFLLSLHYLHTIRTIAEHYPNGVLPQPCPALRTELGGAVGLGAAVGAELASTRLSGSER